MFVRPRVIPTLLIDDGNLVKTKQFKKPDYLGDPINAIKIFNEKGVDELCVLDISATQNGKEPDLELLEKMATEAFMPLSYGGGVTTMEQIKNIFFAGFEKIIINTSLIKNEQLIKQAVEYFGSQSIVASIDYRKKWGREKCFIMDGTKKVDMTPLELAQNAEKLGVGEILLYSIERDGMRTGYDVKTIGNISKNLGIPLIACGGARNTNDLKAALDAGADAVAAGSIFVYFGERNAVLINYPDETELYDLGIYAMR